MQYWTSLYEHDLPRITILVVLVPLVRSCMIPYSAYIVHYEYIRTVAFYVRFVRTSTFFYWPAIPPPKNETV